MKISKRLWEHMIKLLGGTKGLFIPFKYPTWVELRLKEVRNGQQNSKG